MSFKYAFHLRYRSGNAVPAYSNAVELNGADFSLEKDEIRRIGLRRQPAIVNPINKPANFKLNEW